MALETKQLPLPQGGKHAELAWSECPALAVGAAISRRLGGSFCLLE